MQISTKIALTEVHMEYCGTSWDKVANSDLDEG